MSITGDLCAQDDACGLLLLPYPSTGRKSGNVGVLVWRCFFLLLLVGVLPTTVFKYGKGVKYFISALDFISAPYSYTSPPQ